MQPKDPKKEQRNPQQTQTQTQNPNQPRQAKPGFEQNPKQQPQKGKEDQFKNK